MTNKRCIPLLALAIAALAAGGCGNDDDGEAGANEQAKAKPAATKTRDFPVQLDFPLAPDIPYTTTLFEPKVTLTLPSGAWRTVGPESRDHLAIGLVADDTFHLGGYGVNRMTKVADPKTGAATVADAVDAPDDYIQWLADHPRLESTQPKAVTVAGMKGTQIEVSPKSFPKRRPQGCEDDPPFEPCLVLYFDGAEPVWYYKSGHVRFTALDVGGEQIVLEELVDPEERFDAIAKEKLDPISASLKFSD